MKQMGVVLAPIPASQRMVALPDPLEESVPAMKINWILLPFMLFVVSLFAVSTATADAAEDGQVKVVTVAAEDAAEATTDEKASCCPAPCITYRQRGRCRKVCCGCDPPVKTTLKVADPCCCKTCYDIPICLPACCKGEPCIKDRCGVCCKGVIVYKWCCGYKVKVVIKKCGDIVVTSYRC